MRHTAQKSCSGDPRKGTKAQEKEREKKKGWFVLGENESCSGRPLFLPAKRSPDAEILAWSISKASHSSVVLGRPVVIDIKRTRWEKSSQRKERHMRKTHGPD